MPVYRLKEERNFPFQMSLHIKMLTLKENNANISHKHKSKRIDSSESENNFEIKKKKLKGNPVDAWILKRATLLKINQKR